MLSPDNLWVAASDGDLSRVRDLLESGVHRTMDADENGYTCLHAAASYGHMGLLHYLLSRSDCNLMAADNDGDTPLHVCEEIEPARLLIQAGADINALNTIGLRPIDIAQQEEYTDLYEFFLSLASGEVDSTGQHIAKRRRADDTSQ